MKILEKYPDYADLFHKPDFFADKKLVRKIAETVTNSPEFLSIMSIIRDKQRKWKKA